MNNYSCLDYWCFFWDDVSREIQITFEQFMALFNDEDVPIQQYRPVSTVEPRLRSLSIQRDYDNTSLYQRNRSTIEKPKEIITQVIPIKPSENISQVIPIKKDIIILIPSQSDDEFEVLDMV